MIALRLSRGCRCPRIHFSRRLSSSVSSSGGGEGGGENDENPPPPPPPPPPSFSSYLSDVKASLLRQSPPRDPSSSFSRPPVPPSLLSPKPSKVDSLEEIRKNLSEFRRRSAAPIQSDGKDGSHPPRNSFQELYKSKVIGNNVDDGNRSLESIRESLRNLRSSRGGSEMTTPSAFSLKSLKDSLKLKPPPQTQTPTPGSHFLGEEGSLPHSIFGKELEGKKTESESRALKTEFVKMYTYNELGKKLKLLRPPAAAAAKKDWFSLEELNERLIKLREMEVKEMESWVGGFPFKDLRDSLLTLRKTSDESSKKSSMQRLALLGQLGGQVTPSFMLSPPKDHLVEKYYHPDNMSSAEKLNLELKRVRDEFKMSESDCGSSRVQVAQLTTKIKHLSSALHKKDKHSRKGLQAMVQRRKKILKYLRRTDWDSYCLVLSKLGLRDNPDYKN